VENPFTPAKWSAEFWQTRLAATLEFAISLYTSVLSIRGCFSRNVVVILTSVLVEENEILIGRVNILLAKFLIYSNKWINTKKLILLVFLSIFILKKQ
jgi:hypothetical protein